MGDFQVIDNYLMVRLPKEVDHHQAGFICEQADSYLYDEKVCHVVFDFEDTQFMDSSGIGIIIGRYKKIACLGGKVYAIHVGQQVNRILQLSGLCKILQIIPCESCE